MLGDAGANVLGAVLVLAVVLDKTPSAATRGSAGGCVASR